MEDRLFISFGITIYLVIPVKTGVTLQIARKWRYAVWLSTDLSHYGRRRIERRARRKAILHSLISLSFALTKWH